MIEKMEVRKMIRCKKCGHEWNYKGQSTHYVTCPQCMTKVKRDVGNKEQD